MKIIAKVDSDRLLCEVTIDELALLNGYRSRYEEGCDVFKMSQVGTECNLTKMANTSRYVRNLNKDTLEKAKQKLQDGITTIDEAMDSINKLQLFEILKEESQIE